MNVNRDTAAGLGRRLQLRPTAFQKTSDPTVAHMIRILVHFCTFSSFATNESQIVKTCRHLRGEDDAQLESQVQ